MTQANPFHRLSDKMPATLVFSHEMSKNSHNLLFIRVILMSRKPRTHRITLARVAQESEVSVTTASLILSGRPENLSQFQSQTIDRVRVAAERLGYRANLFAASLLADRSSFFALVIRGGHSNDPRAWQFGAYESDLLYGVTETAPPEVYPVVAVSGEQTSELKVRSIERIMAGGVFGSIVRTPSPLLMDCLRDRIERDHPTMVVFPRRLEDWPENAIDVDNHAVGSRAGELLLAAGAKRWLILRDSEYPAGQDLRQRGSQAIAAGSGVECTVLELPAGRSVEQLESLVATTVRDVRPDGIFAMTLHTSVATVAACRSAGLVLGRDVRLVGCDCAFRTHSSDPLITSVDVSWFEAGAAAIRSLVAMAEVGQSRRPSVLLEPRVVPGNTCPVPPHMVLAATRQAAIDPTVGI
jgi:DNA-binding LacI/PurR family transcriptional regulator